MKKLLALLAVLGLFFASCSDDDVITDPDPDPDPVNYSSGSADFSNYVALGNSLTAGFSDAALFIDGQTASFPNMLAGAFALAGGGDFTTPFMADNLGGMTLGGTPIPNLGNRLILDFSTGDPLPTPVPGQGGTEVSNILSGPFNNMGVPGAKSYHLVAPGYGNVAGVAAGLANPYFARFASDPGTTVLVDAVVQNPSFFTLWIGNNDVLSFATSGGSGIDQTGNLEPATYGGNDLTDPQVFGGVYTNLLDALTANGAKGVVANIPDVTKIPFFTTVPFAPLDPTNPDFGPQIPLLNAQFEDLNNVFAFLGVPERSITFSTTGPSALLIKDEDLPDLSAQITATLIGGGLDAPTAGLLGMLYGQARQATADDLIVFTSQTVIAELNTDAFAMLQGLGLPAATAGQLSVNGITYPLEDQWVLTPEEQEMVANATANYNATIAALANAYDLALYDADAAYTVIEENGVTLSDGSVVTAVYATGGGFSLDGIHPSPRGSAIIANGILDAIEAKYGAELPRIDPLDFTGLYIN